MIFPTVTRALVAMGILLLAAGGLARGQGDEIAVPSGVKYQLIGTYGVDRLNHILTAELKEFCAFPMSYPPARYPVKLYRITYPSVIPEQNNRPTVASGLLAMPESGADTMPVVSYQHGTVFSKTEVPSHPEESMETRLMIAQFAGQGYLVIAADYFGKGASTEKDSFLVKASTQQACLDMMLAAEAVVTDLKLHRGPLFLSGWSQGGWATMVFLNKLESLGIPVRAAAVASAPTDMFAIMNRWLHAPEDHDAVYLPGLAVLQLNAYENYYGLPGLTESAFKPQYVSVARDLYLNKISYPEAAPQLPKRMIDLFQDSFVAASSVGSSRYWSILQDNQAYRWRSKTPLHTYFGDDDEVVPPYIATLPVDYQKLMGGAETTGVEVAKADHRGTFVYAVADQKKWFDQLLSPSEVFSPPGGGSR
jgi:pimeloyl-ACP methyl ester carboxylesterase